ncbi:hypothetical protein [Halorubrum laminariae]|uniref:Rhomboid family intramembrane serine protease n=1 Tax=Halorubrum laminariae TaxID=1433523 RepID=A0ABD6C0P5_9EURY|nr:hypothetical protein [Halorubrum laminariae]
MTVTDGGEPIHERSEIERSGPTVPEAAPTRVGIDAVVFLVVPVVVLAAVFLLSDSAKRAAAFSYTEPTLLTAFTAHYVHLTVPHLVGNVVGFVLLASVAYGVSLLAGRRRLFFASAITFVLVFPFVLSGLNLAVPRNAIGYGFSGVNMAFFGYIAVVLPVAIDERFGVAWRRYAPGQFFLSVAYIALIALPVSTVSAGIGAASAAFALPYGREAVRGRVAGCSRTAGRKRDDRRDRSDTDGRRDGGHEPLRATLRRILARPADGELVVAAAVVLLGYPFIGFPTVSPTGTQVNVYVHFLGYALAFLVVHVSLLADRDGTTWRDRSVAA